MSPTTNYFVCTLGEAAALKQDPKYETVGDLLYHRGRRNADDAAIGFFVHDVSREETPLTCEVLTFSQVLKNIIVTADLLNNVLKSEKKQVVGLLSASTPEFFFIWLACTWLGCPILLIAPECSPSGVAALCKACEVSCLIADKKHHDLARQAVDIRRTPDHDNLGMHLVSDVFADRNVFKMHVDPASVARPSTSVKQSDIAYFHHTSGTSSGTPKPIPQTHHGAVGALPNFEDSKAATFTTTPLYHGGPADTFRAWTSGAMVFLFPSAVMPITANNVIKCLETAKAACIAQNQTHVKYFTSVPYILQIMSESPQGLSWLQSMDLVGVGGAALAKEVGDKLVQQKINLVSRYGSAECGFLMSSHREYGHDGEWQYLRIPDPHPFLKLELRDNGLSELVVLKGWPHMAKVNREDGSFATSDLFEAHSSILNAWRYHSRADSQLTLLTGKKFDPAPLEDALTAASDLIAGSYIFGNQRQYPGVLVFRSKDGANTSDADLVEEISPIVERLNREGQSHVRIAKSMIVPMAYTEQPLEKTSKGTLLRGRAEERYREIIEKAYDSPTEDSETICSDDELPSRVQDIIRSILSLSSPLDLDIDLFSLGVDSIAGMQIRQQLQKLVPKNGLRLPINVVEDCGSIRQLVTYLQHARQGVLGDDAKNNSDVHDQMRHLVLRYSHFKEAPKDGHGMRANMVSSQSGHVVVLTGATGSLGAHVLDRLRKDESICRVYCLVRGTDDHAARERVNKALQQRGLEDINFPDERVMIVLAKLREDELGIESSMYHRIAQEMTVILHLAWSVNFRMRLQSFAKDNLRGLQNMIDLALSAPGESPRFVYCSSTASALAYKGSPIPETTIADPAAATDTGYSQSKWVAEHLCLNASQLDQLRGKMVVLRVGQLSGDTETGAWNVKEAWPLLLSTVKITKCLPRLRNEILDWLPVDLAARIVLDSVFSLPSNNDTLPTLHVLNQKTGASWESMLSWMSRLEDFEIVSAAEWLDRLGACTERDDQHPSYQLLDFWRQAYLEENDQGAQSTRKTFAMATSEKALPSLQEMCDVDEEYFRKLWSWIDANI